jgi:hypothetical protein
MTPFTPPLLQPTPFDAAENIGQIPVPPDDLVSSRHACTANIRLPLFDGLHTASTIDLLTMYSNTATNTHKEWKEAETKRFLFLLQRTIN